MQRMRELGWGINDLAREMRLNSRSVRRCLNGETENSYLAMPIARTLGIPLPGPVLDGTFEAEWLALGRDLARLRPEFFEQTLSRIQAVVDAARDEELQKTELIKKLSPTS